MLDFNNVDFHIGDRVNVKQVPRVGSIESIRIISNGQLVEQFSGNPSDVVVTVYFGDGIVNKRGIDITPVVS